MRLRNFTTLCSSLVVSGISLVPLECSAGSISQADFSSAAMIEDFESFGTGLDYVTPITVNGATYRANGDKLRHSSKFGPTINRSGVAIANGELPSPGWIEITLGIPAIRAGAYVGQQFPWAADVQFFDTNDLSLGSLHATGSGGDNQFVAWQSTDSLIRRIRFSGGSNVAEFLVVDDFITEVPEPAVAACLGIGLFVAGTVCRWPRRCKVNDEPYSPIRNR